MQPKRTEAPDIVPTDDISEADDIFAQEIARGESATDALKKSRDCSNMKPETIWSYASRIRNDSKVNARISEYRKAMMGKAVESLEQHVLGMYRLREIAIESGNIGAAVQAHQCAGKASGHYTEQFRDMTQDPTDLLKQIAEMSPALASQIAKEHGIAWDGETQH